MNFPDTTFIDLLYFIINQPSLGGIVVFILAGGIFLGAVVALRWIIVDDGRENVELYAYPTRALHHHEPIDE